MPPPRCGAGTARAAVDPPVTGTGPLRDQVRPAPTAGPGRPRVAEPAARVDRHGTHGRWPRGAGSGASGAGAARACLTKLEVLAAKEALPLDGQ